MQKESNKTVLIVDDNRDAADTLAILVRIAGYEAMVAYDSEAAFALAHEKVPDVILHDVGMPIVNGYDAARRLRKCKKFAKTILIALTAYDTTEDRKRSTLAGFDIHLSKPLDFEDLKATLCRSRPD